ncbi:MAG: hypothetical protein IJ003_06425 [Candidatus Gastranaerophilales bacterium]|nr:hypothetical protein [Candidatus Gastranaerophilales bacterium]
MNKSVSSKIGYKQWKADRENNQTKKSIYLNANPISKEEYDQVVKKAKIVLDAVDIMDDYSQKKAESREIAFDTLNMASNEGGTYFSLALAAIVKKLTKGADIAFKEVMSGDFKNIKKLTPAVLTFVIPMVIITIISSLWGSKKQIEGSRLGRIESIEKDLSSLNQFAVLDENQEKTVHKIAQNIPDEQIPSEDDENIDIKKSFKDLLHGDKNLENKYYNFNSNINNQIANIHTIKLSKEQELQAKKDKELIQTIVEKVDIASQEYSETAELSTSTIRTFAFSSGGILGFILDKVLANTALAKASGKIGMAVYIIAGIVGSIISGKIELQAAKVGRYKAKKELLENPQQLVYVEAEKYKNNDIKVKKAKKKGIFATLKQLFKDNKEYNEYLNTNALKNKKIKLAKEKIVLSEKQKADAKLLQNNTFKMFNKLDEFTQTYAEKTEAIGESVNNIFSNLLSAFQTVMATYAIFGKSKFKGGKMLAMVASLIPEFIINFITTKAQKKASKVGAMNAINSLDDPRHFASKSKDDIEFRANSKEKALSPINQQYILNNSK